MNGAASIRHLSIILYCCLSSLLGTRGAHADTQKFNTQFTKVDSICDQQADKSWALNWRKLTLQLFQQNNMLPQYDAAQQACRLDTSTPYTAVAGNVAVYKQTGAGSAKPVPDPASQPCGNPTSPWPQANGPGAAAAGDNAEADLTGFAKSFVTLLVRIQSGDPLDVGNGIFLKDPVPGMVSGAGRKPDWSTRKAAAISRYLEQMKTGGSGSEQWKVACYAPGTARQILADLASGKQAFFSIPPRQQASSAATRATKPPVPRQGAGNGAAESPSQPEATAGSGGTDAGAASGKNTITWGGTFGLGNLRLRANPAQLAEVGIDTNGQGNLDTALADDNAILYISGEQAKLSFQENAGSNQVANNIIGALGYDIPIRKGTETFLSTDVVPYVATDREIKYTNTHTKITASPTASTFDTGLVLSQVFGVSNEGSATTSKESFDRLYVLIRPDFLRNYIDNSEIWSVNARLVPLVTGPLPLNSLRPVCLGGLGNLLLPLCPSEGPANTYKWTPLLDFRYERGWFTARGNVPANLRVNEDFSRLGGMIGSALEFNWIPSLPIDYMAEYVDFLPLEGFNKSLGYFQTQITFNLSKNIAINATYENGRRIDTAQRYEAWSLSFGLLY